MSDKLVLITGTSSGLGQEICLKALDEGWHVLGFARRENVDYGESYHHQSIDLSDLVAVRSLAEKSLSKKRFDTFDQVALVNNAGTIEPVGPLQSARLKDLERANNLNITVPLWLMGYLKLSCGSKLKKIVNISSGAARKPYQGWASYCAGKSALKAASEVMAAENQDLEVLSYEPGVIDTAMQEEVRAFDPRIFPHRQRFADLHDSGQLVPPHLPASEVVSFLEAGYQEPNYQAYRYGDRT
ncbi:SDR family NAD(P)-dependent oxidoreductase [Pseudobacteriovorax antillogorgiicola]|uniref:Benzil reductase ((S)-benzoin forming) n=1 Tax=Pseudobacteriovorax antillogorgiicola TaxID=1513793 RepID=A0A1Y6CMQ9_9BACT|nr:SDR family NAD(P)-dependent oxidoreductase [Pseudobacteriovorax antillogorgiicola]TCS44979.1 benzil reductase ((S)-benzoin forming) [Pseudobacteriovorax antillogorgiicola]SMF76729.1 benzil reductase ((S)-benzoin forming) [Pseudobacteriovorax antillogorgiicola]